MLHDSTKTVYLIPSFHYDNTWHFSSRFYARFTNEKGNLQILYDKDVKK
ncbi:MAG: hypothetical protein HY606_09940 [Planctomycetes bacterium]|nr:hypothetical protein [Planctomycetota bacterium]